MAVDKDPGFSFAVPGLLDHVGAGGIAVQAYHYGGTALEDFIGITLIEAHADGFDGDADAGPALFEPCRFLLCQLCGDHGVDVKSVFAEADKLFLIGQHPVADHKKDFLRVCAIHDPLYKVDGPVLHPCGPPVGVEAPAKEDDGYLVDRHLANLVFQAVRALQTAAADHEGLLRQGLFLNLLVKKFFRSPLSAQNCKGGLFAGKCLHTGGKHSVLCLSHGEHLFIGQVQHALQGELFIDGICPVDGASVGPLDAVDAVGQILPERMMTENAEIIETDIGSQLEFQDSAGFTQVFDQLPAKAGVEIGGIESVADPHGRHGLAGGERLPDTAQALCDVVLQRIVFSGVNSDDKTRMVSGDGYQLPDQGLQIADVIDLLADDIRSCDIGVAGNGTQSADLVLNDPLGFNLVADDGQGDPAEGSQEAEYHAGFLCDGGHAGMDLSQQGCRLVRLDQAGVGDLHVADSPFPAAARDPQ